MYKIMVKRQAHERFAEQKPKMRYRVEDHDKMMSRARWLLQTNFQVKVMSECCVTGAWGESLTMRNNANCGNGPLPEATIKRMKKLHAR